MTVPENHDSGLLGVCGLGAAPPGLSLTLVFINTHLQKSECFFLGWVLFQMNSNLGPLLVGAAFTGQGWAWDGGASTDLLVCHSNIECHENLHPVFSHMRKWSMQRKTLCHVTWCRRTQKQDAEY